MSIHRSLSLGSTISSHRNVLTREERLEKLEQQEKWTEKDSVLSLPKVRNIKVNARAKKKEKKEGEEAAE